MSMYRNPTEHADNPPSTWSVVKRGERSWALVDRAGTVLDTFTTKRDAVMALTEGSSVRLYDKETRWYAGEHVSPWRDYAELVNS